MRTRVAAGLALSCTPLLAPFAMAQNTLTVPIEVVRVANPDLSVADRGSVTLFRISPQYTIQSVDGDSRREFSFGGMIERSSDTDLSGNRNLPRVSALWERSSAVSVLGLRASLEELSTRETEFAEFGRVALDTTERVGTIGATWTRELTADSSLALAASHMQVNYDTALLRDYNETLGSAIYTRELTPNSRYSITGVAATLDSDGGPGRANRVGLSLGYEADVLEGMRLSASGGVARFNRPVSKTHPVGALRLSYEGERIGYAAGWARDVVASGAVGGYERAETFDASVSLPLSADTTAALGVTRARSLEAIRDSGTTAYARVRSELTQFWALTLGLEHRRARPGGGGRAQGGLVSAGLVYSHPDF